MYLALAGKPDNYDTLTSNPPALLYIVCTILLHSIVAIISAGGMSRPVEVEPGVVHRQRLLHGQQHLGVITSRIYAAYQR